MPAQCYTVPPGEQQGRLAIIRFSLTPCQKKAAAACAQQGFALTKKTPEEARQCGIAEKEERQLQWGMILSAENGGG